MRAIVCDKCGKVVLIPDRSNMHNIEGVHQLYSDGLGISKLDLCDECAEELIGAVRNVLTENK